MASIGLKQKIIGKMAEYMVTKSPTAPSIARVRKPLSQSKTAFITTSGVHLKTQKPFDTKGDHTFRIIPKDVDYNYLTISHTHYDTRDAMKDINCVFPLEILRHLASEGYIKEVSERHFGFMGYIPRLDLLTRKSAKEIGDMLVEDGVDIALLSPG